MRQQSTASTRRASKRARRAHGESSISSYAAPTHKLPNRRLFRVQGLENGKRIELGRGFETEKAAADHLRKLRERQQLQGGALATPPSVLTLSDFLYHTWLPAVRDDRAESTYELYEYIVRLHIEPYLGPFPLVGEGSLQSHHIRKWQRTLEENGVGERTRTSAFTRLRTALQLAAEMVRETGLQYNPADLARAKRDKQTEAATTHDTEDDEETPNLERTPDPLFLADLLAYTRDRPLGIAVALGVYLGLRRGEMIALRWSDVDFAEGTLTVRRHAVRVSHRPLLMKKGVKMNANGGRTLALPAQLLEQLLEHRDRQAFARAAAKRWSARSNTVLCSRNGTPVEPRSLNRWYAPQVAAVRLQRNEAMLDDDTRLHTLRHDCASLMLDRGVPISDVAYILGHAKPDITLRIYAHVVNKRTRKGALVMDDIFSARAPLQAAL